MKKTLLSLILTAVCLCIASPLFTFPVSIEVGFVTYLKKPTEFRVHFLTKKQKNFKNAPVITEQVNETGDIRMTFDIHAQYVSSFKIESTPRVKIKDLYIKGRKKTLLPNRREKIFAGVNVSADRKINFNKLIIFSTLFFLFFFKLFSYIGRTSRGREASKADIMLIMAFFTMLFIPMMRINTGKISDLENKTLKKYSPLFRNGRLNDSYGKYFNEWFSDRFFLRKPVIKTYNRVISKLKRNENKYVLVGQDNWLFYRSKNNILDYQNRLHFTDRHLQQAVQYLKDINEWAKKHNKAFYVLFAPDKYRIYNEYYPNYIMRSSGDKRSIITRIVSELRNNTDVRVYYPQAVLRNNKDKGLLYWKGDTHWNELGAYIAYRGFIDLVKRGVPGITPLELPFDVEYEEQKGDLSFMAPEAEINFKPAVHKKTSYRFKAKCYEIGMNKEGTSKNYRCLNKKAPPEAKKALVLRDSFYRGIAPYMSEHFSQMDEYWQRDITPEILKEMKHFDVLIYEIRAGAAYQLRNHRFPHTAEGRTESKEVEIQNLEEQVFHMPEEDAPQESGRIENEEP